MYKPSRIRHNANGSGPGGEEGRLEKVGASADPTRNLGCCLPRELYSISIQGRGSLVYVTRACVWHENCPDLAVRRTSRDVLVAPTRLDPAKSHTVTLASMHL